MLKLLLEGAQISFPSSGRQHLKCKGAREEKLYLVLAVGVLPPTTETERAESETAVSRVSHSHAAQTEAVASEATLVIDLRSYLVVSSSALYPARQKADYSVRYRGRDRGQGGAGDS